MSSSSRRFGTDVSNIPSDVLRKTPSKKINNKSQPQPFTPKSNGSQPHALPQEIKSSPLFDAMEDLMDAINISIDDEISVKSPISKLSMASSVDFRYERDFLMAFQEFCKEPIDNLIAEVVPGFVHPESTMDSSPFIAKSQLPKSSSIKYVSSSKHIKSSGFADPSMVDSNGVPPVSQSDRAAPFSDPKLPRDAAATSPKEWRVKTVKIKKVKPREQDERRLAARQKQIDIGINTPGYRRFCETVPLNARTKAHPKIPDIYQICSKRSWDGQVLKWRRQLHDYDPPKPAGESIEDDLTENAAERHESSEEGEVLDA